MAVTNTRPVAVVTGASSGIGLELAKEFARNGFDLIVSAESEKLSAVTPELQTLGAQVHAVQADLSTYDGVEQLYSAISSGGRPVDALAVNAGIGTSGDFATETSLTQELQLINLNVTGAVHLTKRVLPEMVSRGEGRILITSSIAGVMPAPYEAVYGASKAFLKSFGEGIREELKDKGVTVTVLMPGATETNFFERADMMDTKIGQSEKDDAAEVAHDGFEALMAGKDHIVAGSFKNKVQAAAAHALPDPTVAKMHKAQSAPGSGSK